MTGAQKIVDYAISQIGTAEDPLGSNKQKYGALIDSTDWYLYKEGDKTWRHLVNGYDWCTQFVDASFITCFGIDKAREMLYRPQYNNYGAVVKYAFNYFKNAGKGFTKEKYNPKPGDVIYFQNSQGLSHTGIVIDVNDTYVTTVEGNTGKNGWYVAKKSYKRTDSYIYGYGVPDYESIEPKKEYVVGYTYKVLCNELTIREKPDVNSKSLGTLKRYDKIKCNATEADKDGNIWMKGGKGWSAGYYNGQTYIGDYGWMQKNGKWYYYDADGNMLTSSFIRYKGEKYYVGADGAMVTGWQKIDNIEYYFYEEGHMARGEWIAKGKQYFFLNQDGTQTYPYIGTWEKDKEGKYWFEDTSGWYAKDRTVYIGGKIYAFDDKGYLVD